MRSKATNSSRLSAYHFVLKSRMTNAQTIKHHILAISVRRNSCLALGRRYARSECARKRLARKTESGRSAPRALARIYIVRGNELPEKECHWRSESRSLEVSWADQLKLEWSVPKASCIQISRLCRHEAGDDRDIVVADRLVPSAR